jgi:carnitine-CoA ligase
MSTRPAAITISEALRRRAAQEPNAPFLKVGTGPWLSCRDLDEASDRVAGGLASLGVVKGDRVALVCTNRVEAVEMLFACAKLGAILVPLNYHLRGEFLLYQLRDCDAATLVVDGAGAAMCADVLPGTAVRTVILLDEDSGWPGSIPYQVLKATTTAVPEAGLHRDDLLGIIYTSGTTGLPKGCMLSHGYYLASGASVQAAGWVVPGDRMLTAFPHFHASFQVNAFMSALVLGASIILEPAFQASRMMRRAKEEDATMIWGVGAMASAILAQRPLPDDRVESLRLAAWVPLHPGAQLQFQERFGGTVNCEIFGQTEAVPIVVAQWDRPTRRPFVFGQASPLYDVRIVDGLDQELPVGQVGEIVLRPKMAGAMFSGYWRKPAETVQAARNLWHHTGDLGSLDADGVLSFKDRAKDAIRRRGENVSCFELELAVGEHPKVREVAASAVPSSLGEDDIKISIVLAAGVSAAPAELFGFFCATLPYFAVPRYVDLRESMPLTATGRVRKETLRDEGVTAAMWDLPKLGFTIGRNERRGTGQPAVPGHPGDSTHAG